MSASEKLFIAMEPRYDPVGWQALWSEPRWVLALLVISIVAAAVTIYCSRKEQIALPPGRWRFLAILRLLALVVIGCLLAGWERRPVSEQIEPSRVVLLTDGSTSMGLVDEWEFETDGNELDKSFTRLKVANALLPKLAKQFAESHEVVEARFGSGVVYRPNAGTANQEKGNQKNESKIEKANAKLNSNVSSQGNSTLSETDYEQVESREGEFSKEFYAPRDAETRIGDALESVYRDYSSLPLAAVVLFTDGRSNGGVAPVRIAEEYAKRGILIHTVGLGPKFEPKQVQIRSLSIPSQVFAGDPFEATVRLAAQGAFEGDVQLELLLVDKENDSEKIVRNEQIQFTKETPIIIKRFEIDSPPPGRYRLLTRLISLGAQTTSAGSFESVDQKTSVLLVASGPLRDYRFLRDQLFRDDSFTVDAYLQSASSGITQDVRTMLDSFPAEIEQLDAYDVVVAFDANWEEIGELAQQLIQRWVLKKGGGLMIVKGSSYASQLVEQTPENPIGSLLPVQFLDDPLTLAIESSTRSIPLPIQVTAAGEQADFMQLETKFDTNSEAWQRLEGFYEQPLQLETKLGATTYASLGEPEATKKEGQAMLVDQYYGAGRVAYLSTAEIWRLRRIDAKWFTAFYTRLLRHLARGRVKGNAAAGSLFFDRDQYQLGQTMSVRLTRLANAPSNASDNSIVANWLLPTGKAIALPMQPVSGQANSFQTLLPSEEPGEYQVRVKLPLFEEALMSSAAVIMPLLESANPTRDEALLKDLSEITSGIYCSKAEDALSLIDQTPSQSEVRLVLGEVDKKYGSWIARSILGIVVFLLSIEWLLRRLWRLA